MSWYDDQGRLRQGRQPGVQNKEQSVKPGDSFNQWTVIRKVKKGLYECQCSCGTIRSVFVTHLRRGASKSCGHGRPKGSKHYLYGGYGEISGNYWDQIRGGWRRSERPSRTRQFSITIEYAWRLFLKQKRCCALSGLPLAMSKDRIAHTASLDRIDSTKGYVQGNIQWVHKDINRMKNIFPQPRFIELCTAVALHKGIFT